jgi:hypothetical protein
MIVLFVAKWEKQIRPKTHTKNQLGSHVTN